MIAVSALTRPHIHLPPSHRIRLLYAYLTDPASAGGLGVSPGTSQWKRITGIYPLHDPEFDQTWVRSLTNGGPSPNQLDSVRDNVRGPCNPSKMNKAADGIVFQFLVRRGGRVIFRLPRNVYEISNAGRRARRHLSFPRRAVFAVVLDRRRLMGNVFRGVLGGM